jgi:hypothetical protein
MVRTRPTVILVMAILSIIFGSIWVLIGLCTGAQPLIAYNLPFPQPGGGKTYPYRELYDLLQREVPAYVAVEIAHVAVVLALAVLLIISGIGLLGMRSWARGASIFYGAAAVVTVLAYSAFSWVYITPVMQTWMQEFMRNQPAGMPNFTGSPAVAAVGAIVWLIWSLAFPVVLLVTMFLPSVRAAFAGREHGPAKEVSS